MAETLPTYFDNCTVTPRTLGNGVVQSRGFWITRAAGTTIPTDSTLDDYKYDLKIKKRAIADACVHNDTVPFIGDGRQVWCIPRFYAGDLYFYTMPLSPKPLSPHLSGNLSTVASDFSIEQSAVPTGSLFYDGQFGPGYVAVFAYTPYNLTSYQPKTVLKNTPNCQIERRVIVSSEFATGRPFTEHFSDNERIMDRVLLDDPYQSVVKSIACSTTISSGSGTALTIPLSNTLPGIFDLRIVPDSISGDLNSATLKYKILVLEHDNTVECWAGGLGFTVEEKDYPTELILYPTDSDKPPSTMYYDQTYSNIGTRHPYLRETPETAVWVTPYTPCTNVIPGLSITFSGEPQPNGIATIAVGFEFAPGFSYVNSVEGLENSQHGRSESFSLLSHYGTGVLGFTQKIRDEFRHTTGFSENAYHVVRHHIFNVTGKLQTGCKLHVRPFVRIDFSNILHGMSGNPIAAWYMGCKEGGELEESIHPYTLTFRNYKTHKPSSGTTHHQIDLMFDGNVSMLLHEINPETHQPTGTVLPDGRDVIIGRLYRWDSIGVYFSLTLDVLNKNTESGYASLRVWCRPGCKLEKHPDLSFFQSQSGNAPELSYIVPPYSVDIGMWDALESETGHKYPGSPYLFSNYTTGKIQTQGYAYTFPTAEPGTEAVTYYNHAHTFPTCPRILPGEEYPGLCEYVMMVTCDDPNYFAVVPRTFYVREQLLADLVDLPDPNDALCAFNTDLFGTLALRDVDTHLSGVASVHNIDKNLMLRVNQISREMHDILQLHGVTVDYEDID